MGNRPATQLDDGARVRLRQKYRTVGTSKLGTLFARNERFLIPGSLFQRELAQIGVAVAEQLGTAGQVLHISVVDLFRLDRDRLVLMSLQRRRPQVERPRIVRL